eukprot:SAG11_NODE_2066_length_3868_cov_10.653224_5_plen_48_part_01
MSHPRVRHLGSFWMSTYPLVFLEEAVWAPPLLKSAIGQVTRFHDGLDR